MLGLLRLHVLYMIYGLIVMNDGLCIHAEYPWIIIASLHNRTVIKQALCHLSRPFKIPYPSSEDLIHVGSLLCLHARGR